MNATRGTLSRRWAATVLLLAALAGGATVRGAKLDLPRMPVVEFAEPQASGRDAATIRAELERTLPPGARLVLSGPAPASASGNSINSHDAHLPVPVSTITGRFPVLDLADERYGRIQFDFLPVLADWFEALAAALGQEPLALQERGLTTNKVARLMTVFVTLRLDRQRGADRGYAPAIGWGRFHFNAAWGRFTAGSVATLVVIGTDRGWVLLDPYTRRIRPLRTADTSLVPEFIVL